MVVASAGTDSDLRIIAVKELLEQMSSPASLTESELVRSPFPRSCSRVLILPQESVQAALTSRVYDTDPQVLDVLYDNPDIIAPLLLKDAKTFVDGLSQSFCSLTSNPKRSVLKIHMTFLAKYFCKRASKEIISEVFYKIFFPFLLFSKPRQHTVEMVWDIIKENMLDSATTSHELLHGCAALVAEEKAKNEESIGMMCKTNLGISSKIARTRINVLSLTLLLNDVQIARKRADV